MAKKSFKQDIEELENEIDEPIMAELVREAKQKGQTITKEDVQIIKKYEQQKGRKLSKEDIKAIIQELSKRKNARAYLLLTQELKENAMKYAKAHGVSFNELVAQALEEKMEKGE